VSRGQHGGSPTVVNLSFLDRSRYFFFPMGILEVYLYTHEHIHAPKYINITYIMHEYKELCVLLLI
jgi:hypothetical protein